MKKRIVIVGGGFVGTRVAVKLARARLADIEIILISPDDHFLFSPLLIDLLAKDLPSEASLLSLPELARRHGFSYIQGSVQSVDREKRALTYQSPSGQGETLSYDSIVLATGSSVNYYGIPGAAEHTLPLKAIEDVERIWQRTTQKILEKQGSLSIAIIGAGPMGIEALYAVKTWLKEQNIGHPAIHLIEATPTILPGFNPAIQRTVDRLLRTDGVHVHVGKPVQSATADQISLGDLSIQYDIALWCAGIQPCVPNITPAPTGPLCPDATLRIDEHTFVGGDMASIECAGKRFPKTGQSALQLADLISQNILYSCSHQPLISIQPLRPALILSLGKTGIIQLGSFLMQTRWTSLVRRTIYRFRLWQIQRGW